MKFSQKLKQLRKEKGLSQTELAKGCRVPFYTIVALENDRSNVPLITTVLKFSKYFKISVEELIKGVKFVSSTAAVTKRRVKRK